jgi:hypothetical protein
MRKDTIESYHKWRKDEYPAYAEIGLTFPEAILASRLNQFAGILEEINENLIDIKELLMVGFDLGGAEEDDSENQQGLSSKE